MQSKPSQTTLPGRPSPSFPQSRHGEGSVGDVVPEVALTSGPGCYSCYRRNRSSARQTQCHSHRRSPETDGRRTETVRGLSGKSEVFCLQRVFLHPASILQSIYLECKEICNRDISGNDVVKPPKAKPRETGRNGQNPHFHTYGS